MTAGSSVVAEMHRGGQWLATVSLEVDDEQPALPVTGGVVVLDVHDAGVLTPVEARDLATALLDAADELDAVTT